MQAFIIGIFSVMVEVVDVVEVVVAEGYCEASKFSLMNTEHKLSASGVASPLVWSPSPSWPVLVTESSIMLGVVMAVEVDV